MKRRSAARRNAKPSPRDKKKIIILGGGPNRIGQGIEFDYCCCHAAFSLSEQGYETIMVNCNPETVSTDYDTSDRLYFEPLTAEDVLEIVRQGTVEGHAGRRHRAVRRPDAAEARQHACAMPACRSWAPAPTPSTWPRTASASRSCSNDLDLKQPRNATAMTAEETIAAARAIGYPVILRPSYVLGGRGMVVVSDEAAAEGPGAVRRAVPHLRRQSGADRRLPQPRHRSGCRRDLRQRRRRLHRRHHGAYRGSGRAFRRQRLLAAAAFAQARHHRRDRAPDHRHGARR